VQSPVAEHFLLTQDCFIADTVLLETAWVLRSSYRMPRNDLAATLKDVLRLPSVSVMNRDLIEWAIDRFAAGADFADMMHLLGGRDTDGFVSFEAKLADLAGSSSPIPVETLA
jgi:predicted nucleic-acid-binding protein